MPKPHIRIIGDIHGYLTCRKGGRSYINLIAPVPYSVQLGDLGWHREGVNFFEIMKRIDPICHRVVTGNHDAYDRLTPHHLGDFGLHTIPLRNGTFDFFFIRGAHSIDAASRLPGLDWWPDLEELNWEQANKAVQMFAAVKPRTVFSHDCPEEVGYLLGLYQQARPSKTHQYLQACLDRHRPEMWVFGHHHRNLRRDWKGTVFMCLDGELPDLGHAAGYIDFDEEGHLLTPLPQ